MREFVLNAEDKLANARAAFDYLLFLLDVVEGHGKEWKMDNGELKMIGNASRIRPYFVRGSALSIINFPLSIIHYFQYLSPRSPVGSPGCHSEGQRRSVRSAFRTRKVSSTLRPTFTWLTT